MNLLDILVKKAKEGVEVRVLYDAMGSRRLPRKFFRPLIAAGGKVSAFFPGVLPHLNLQVNYRNHRKLSNYRWGGRLYRWFQYWR